MLVLVCYGFKMFSFPILNSPLRFSDKGHKEAIVIPATCTANGLRCLYIWRERFDSTSVQKSNF